MKTSPITDERIITGIIIANDWDVHGNVTDIAIYSDNEEIFYIHHNSQKQSLIDIVRKKVKVIGRVIGVTEGRKHINVSSFQEILNTIR